jgi:hypothetical protein
MERLRVSFSTIDPDIDETLLLMSPPFNVPAD